MKSDMGAVVRVMQLPDSGLEIRDRMWLKITIANAVIGEGPVPGAGARSLPDVPAAAQAQMWWTGCACTWRASASSGWVGGGGWG